MKLPPDVVAFVREHVTSIELLEVLLLLRTSGRAWATDGIAAELRLRPRSVEARCTALTAAGLVVTTSDGVHFAPESPLAPVVDDVAAAYRTHRVSVIELIFSARTA